MQMQIILGKCVPIRLMNRNGFAVFRAAYTCVSSCKGSPRPLWDSVIKEFRVFASDFCRFWDTEILATDASSTGVGACATSFDIEQASVVGGWSDRWRYRRLDPEDWKPSVRAMGERDALHPVES